MTIEEDDMDEVDVDVDPVRACEEWLIAPCAPCAPCTLRSDAPVKDAWVVSPRADAALAAAMAAATAAAAEAAISDSSELVLSLAAIAITGEHNWRNTTR